MVKKLFSNIGQYAKTIFNQVLLKFGANPRTIGLEKGMLRHGHLNSETCFYLYSRDRNPQQIISREVQALHKKCREEFYSGKHFMPLGTTGIPGVTITSKIIEKTNEHDDAHILCVFPCDHKTDPPPKN